MKKYRLVYEKDGHPARVGDMVITFRGDKGRLMGFKEPQTINSSGRVTICLDGQPKDSRIEFFPTVIGARFVEVEDD
jgi:hypothetical protein